MYDVKKKTVSIKIFIKILIINKRGLGGFVSQKPATFLETQFEWKHADYFLLILGQIQICFTNF